MWGRLLRGAGEALLTAGLVVLLFVVYELKVTDLFQEQDQRHLRAELRQEWAAPDHTPAARSAPADGNGSPTADPAAGIGPVRPGEAFAVLHIPRFGRSYQQVVVEGVSSADLQKGPGHYPGTALPGQLGNVVISGHRTTYGRPFNRLDEVRAGDAIVLEVRDRYLTYRVTGRRVVDPSDVEVALPVPDRPGVRPTKRLLTLTTCNPEYSAATRLIVHAELAEATMKSRGLPPVLEP